MKNKLIDLIKSIAEIPMNINETNNTIFATDKV